MFTLIKDLMCMIFSGCRSVEIQIMHLLLLQGPNFCWHIDGNDKLKTYGFSLHGCIDGYSRKVLWLEVATTNKDSAIIAGYYLRAVEKYGNIE